MKRKRKKKRNRLSVSLFPFLAVLICTLGVLIVMLVMAAKSADLSAENAQSEDDQKNLSRIDELEQSLDVRAIQVEGMESARPDTVLRLSDSRSNRSHVEDDIRKLKKEFERVGAALLELHRTPDDDLSLASEYSEEDAAAELDELEHAVLSAREALSQKRELVVESDHVSSRIVPYRGNGGTFRRPIFIECTEDAITLQPSGIRLAKSEFAPPLDPGNMLDAALLTVREYWRRYDLAGDEGSAYPLIVIRPGGAETFVMARHAMKSWDDEFGYELVDSGKNLDFGKNDPQLNAEIQTAIDEARRRQHFRRAQFDAQARFARQRLSRHDRTGSRPGLTASGPYGGFVSSVDGRPESYSESTDGSGSNGESFVSHQSGENRWLGDAETTGSNHQSGAERSSITSPSRLAGNQAGRAGSQAGQSGSQAGQSGSHSGQSGNQAGQSGSTSQQGANQGDSEFRSSYDGLSVAKQRGKNWALPTQTSGGTAYLRPIRVFCGPDFLEIRNSNGELARIPMPGTTSDAVDPLVEEIWKQIDSWGISGASSYWKPQLRFTILPGGEDRFEQLKGLLFQSGIVMKEMKQ